MRRIRHAGAVKLVLMAAAVLCWTATASAQLDPLTILRRVPPTVIVVFDNSLAMLQDGNGNFYDPGLYSTTSDPFVMNAFSSTAFGSARFYRRIFRNFHGAAQSVDRGFNLSEPRPRHALRCERVREECGCTAPF